jgi:catechol 2,3-dioxygenase-like lactoylglutathione lyase family enzyme
MTKTQFALGYKITELFAGVPVRNLQISIEWYQRLFGMPPSFFPNENEAVWSLAEHRWLYIIVEPERAGRSINTIICNDLEALIDQISSRGIDFAKEERPVEGVRKVMYFDPDGNEIGLGRVPAQ